MERVPLPLREKLTVAAALDYPTATEILVSFPDKWELVGLFKRVDRPLYVAGFPPSQERVQSDQFFGLPAEINRSLTTYRFYKLFEPWPQPSVLVDWNEAKGEGRVLAGGHLRVQLQPLGQAQAWTGHRFGVLWECYLHETRRSKTWQEELRQFWQVVEEDLEVRKIFTQPHEPTFEEGYTDFLSNLGYTSDPDFERWWSKEV
jgi:hypothetical protein